MLTVCEEAKENARGTQQIGPMWHQWHHTYPLSDHAKQVKHLCREPGCGTRFAALLLASHSLLLTFEELHHHSRFQASMASSNSTAHGKRADSCGRLRKTKRRAKAVIFDFCIFSSHPFSEPPGLDADMNETPQQYFRAGASSNVIAIPTRQDRTTGERIVCWVDIQQYFKNADGIVHGNVAVLFLTDDSFER